MHFETFGVRAIQTYDRQAVFGLKMVDNHLLGHHQESGDCNDQEVLGKTTMASVVQCHQSYEPNEKFHE